MTRILRMKSTKNKDIWSNTTRLNRIHICAHSYIHIQESEGWYEYLILIRNTTVKCFSRRPLSLSKHVHKITWYSALRSEPTKWQKCQCKQAQRSVEGCDFCEASTASSAHTYTYVCMYLQICLGIFHFICSMATRQFSAIVFSSRGARLGASWYVSRLTRNDTLKKWKCFDFARSSAQ